MIEELFYRGRVSARLQQCGALLAAGAHELDLEAVHLVLVLGGLVLAGPGVLGLGLVLVLVVQHRQPGDTGLELADEGNSAIQWNKSPGMEILLFLLCFPASEGSRDKVHVEIVPVHGREAVGEGDGAALCAVRGQGPGGLRLSGNTRRVVEGDGADPVLGDHLGRHRHRH